MKTHAKILSAFIMSAVLFFPSAVSGQFFYMENENVGKEVQDFSLKIVNGEKVNLKKYRDGKNAIIFFWATWCPHCRLQLDVLNKNKEKLEKDNIKIVLVDVGENELIVDKYLKKANIQFDVFLDIESEIADLYGLVGVPTFYFVDEKGIVRDVQHSLPDDLNEVFSKN